METVMEYISGFASLVLMLALLLPLWAVVAAPIAAALALAYRYLGGPQPVPMWRHVLLAAVFGFLLMPVPTPIITFFYPMTLALFDLPNSLPWVGPLAVPWPWIAVSFVATSGAVFAVMRFGARWWRGASPLGRRAVVTGVGIWSALSLAWIGALVWLSV